MDGKRLGKAGMVILLLAGYYIFVRYTGIGIPCLFRYVFHLQCPGCGITHLLLSLGRGDIYGAFCSHPVIFCFMPFLFWIIIKSVGNYLFTKKTVWRKWESAGMWLLASVLILFGIFRNIP